MHFWVSAARGGLNGHFCWPRKMGTNWVMPAFVNSRFGESGIRLLEGTMVCCFDLKKSRNDCLIWTAVIMDGRSGYCGGTDSSAPGTDVKPCQRTPDTIRATGRLAAGGPESCGILYLSGLMLSWI